MKFLETHFEEYINSVAKNNLHPKLKNIYERFPKNIENMKNLIFYGPSGVGKYSQMLYSIQKYSPSEMKYEKKITMLFNKQPFFFKISDIHYEVDMSLLGCNSKLLWHDIYQQIVDILSAKNDSKKIGFVVCKEFHSIHSELLDIFYSYMQENNSSNVNIKFILLTEQVSFIPDTILNCCQIIHVPRPTKTTYAKSMGVKKLNIDANCVTNIKNLHANVTELMQPHKIMCDKILHEIMNVEHLCFLNFRDLMYDVFIYNLDIFECVWYIITFLINKKIIHKKNLHEFLMKTFHFLKHYNNNYRPIYHLESYLFYITSVFHNYGKCE
jgi:hypothetical protein